jgi:hypothetical protein
MIRTLQRLHNELQDIISILDYLPDVIHIETCAPALLRQPILRCSKTCQDFEQLTISFSQKSKTGYYDWAKLRCIDSDINEFIDTLSEYTSTISAGLGAITMFINLVIPRLSCQSQRPKRSN